MVVSRVLLANITAALDADPFADPVCVLGIPMSRKEARRRERELKSDFASPSVGRTAAVTAHTQRGGQSICEISAFQHSSEVAQP